MDKVISCIVLAAGAGRRMGYKENKIFIPLGRFSIIQRTLQNVANVDGLKEIILVVVRFNCSSSHRTWWKRAARFCSMWLTGCIRGYQYCPCS